jgi:pimeloyl-ACP methyl ester carboxylesterase
MRLHLVVPAVLLPVVLAPVLWLFGPGSPAAAVASTPDFGTDLLLYDRAGDGRVAQVFGELDTADRIAVVVPGVDNTLANFWTGHGHVLRRSPSWQAEQVYEEVGRGSRVAVVAWLGYDPPEGIGRDAFREERAATGATALVHFVDQVAAHRPTASITIVGHSYGSVVVGLAARSLNRQVTDIVAVASPGMGVDRAADLRTRARVWAAAASTDWIHRVPGLRLLGVGHGTLPSDRAFGARPLPVDGVDDHDGYFAPGTGSLRAIASIVDGSGAGAGTPVH